MLRARFALPLLAALALTVAVRPAAAQIGLAAGLNFENFSDIEVGSAEAAVDGSTGFHVGVFYDASVGPLAIRPGVFYRKTGELGFDSGEGFDLSLIEIPIDLRFNFGPPLVPIKPYVLAGPVFGIPSTDNDDFKDAVTEFTVSGNVGFGLQVNLVGTGIKLFPEIRYQFGLSDYIDSTEFQVGGVGLTTEDNNNENLSSFMIRLGIAL